MILTGSDDNTMLAMDKVTLPTTSFPKKYEFPKLSTIQLFLTHFYKSKQQKECSLR